MRSPARVAACQTSVSCATPATGMVQTTARTTSVPRYIAPVIAPISNTLRSTGAAAAAPNRPAAFSTPENSAASEMKNT
jgi:hypothetical protein